MINQENAALKSSQESCRLVASNAMGASSVALCKVGKIASTLRLR